MTIKILSSPSGSRWFKNSRLHREDGPAIEWSNGSKEWYLEGKIHRIDGPALIRNDGYKQWYIDDKLHRLDGPAIENPVSHLNEWWINNRKFSKREFPIAVITFLLKCNFDSASVLVEYFNVAS